MKKLEIIDLNLMPYQEAQAIQLERHAKVLAGEQETLFLVEHPKVITLGRQGGRENLLVSNDYLAKQGIELIQTTRGGNITCHFPGQLVAYPIIRIDRQSGDRRSGDRRSGGIRRFFDDMENAVLATARHFGVSLQRDPKRPGAWINNKKICSIGIAMKKWTSYHGLSFNISRDLSLFKLITLCGLKDAIPTSLSHEAGRDLDMNEVKDVFKNAFQATQNTALATG